MLVLRPAAPPVHLFRRYLKPKTEILPGLQLRANPLVCDHLRQHLSPPGLMERTPEARARMPHKLCPLRVLPARLHRRRNYEKPLDNLDKLLTEMRKHQGPRLMLAKMHPRAHLHPDAVAHHLLADREPEIIVLKAEAVAAELVMVLVMRKDVIPPVLNQEMLAAEIVNIVGEALATRIERRIRTEIATVETDVETGRGVTGRENETETKIATVRGIERGKETETATGTGIVGTKRTETERIGKRVLEAQLQQQQLPLSMTADCLVDQTLQGIVGSMVTRLWVREDDQLTMT